MLSYISLYSVIIVMIIGLSIATQLYFVEQNLRSVKSSMSFTQWQIYGTLIMVISHTIMSKMVVLKLIFGVL